MTIENSNQSLEPFSSRLLKWCVYDVVRWFLKELINASPINYYWKVSFHIIKVYWMQLILYD